MSRQIEKMLSALLINSNQLHWVGGYAHDYTSNGDHNIILYPPQDYLDIKVCRVYHHSFDKLPPFIDTFIAEGDPVPKPSKTTMSKTEAREAGLYFECPAFKILTVNGKETNFGPERRFFDTLWYPSSIDKRLGTGPKLAKTVDTGGLGRWEFLSGGECPMSFRQLFTRYEEGEGKRPFSKENMIEWYQANK